MDLCHEFNALKDTDHPNLPTMYELFQRKGYEFFIVMKYCEGGTLLQFLEGKRSRFDPLGGLGGIQAGVHGAVKGGTGVIKGGTEILMDRTVIIKDGITGMALEQVDETEETTKTTTTRTGMPGWSARPLQGAVRCDNQWDLQLGKHGNTSQSPMVREPSQQIGRNARSPTRNRRRSPLKGRGNADKSPSKRDLSPNAFRGRSWQNVQPQKQPYPRNSSSKTTAKTTTRAQEKPP